MSLHSYAKFWLCVRSSEITAFLPQAQFASARIRRRIAFRYTRNGNKRSHSFRHGSIHIASIDRGHFVWYRTVRYSTQVLSKTHHICSCQKAAATTGPVRRPSCSENNPSIDKPQGFNRISLTLTLFGFPKVSFPSTRSLALAPVKPCRRNALSGFKRS